MEDAGPGARPRSHDDHGGRTKGWIANSGAGYQPGFGSVGLSAAYGGGRESHWCYNCYMMREITQRELRNDSGEIMRALDRGESFVVTRNGAPVGELIPLRRRRFVSAEVVMGAFAGAPRIDPARFRADIDRVLDQDPAA